MATQASVKSPDVSIVVPVYNKVTVLRQCVDSILRQTVADWELILVDDGSTDGSGAICDSYTEDPRVKVLHIPNGGVSDARNLGMDTASGRWLTFVDADDFLLPDFLERLLARADETGAEVVVAGYRQGPDHECMDPHPMPRMVLRHPDYLPYLILPYWGYTWAKMYRADMLRQAQVRFPSKVRLGEDGIFFERVLCVARVLATDDSTAYCYRTESSKAGGRLDYNVEALTLEAATEAAAALRDIMGTDRVYRHLWLYNHVWRVVQSVYQDKTLSRAERLSRLRAMDYRPRWLHKRHGALRPWLVGCMVRYRWYRLLDLVMTRK